MLTHHIIPPLSVGGSFLCPVHSWTSGEDLAGDILRHRCSYLIFDYKNQKFNFLIIYFIASNLNSYILHYTMFECSVNKQQSCFRGVSEWWRGSSVLMKEHGQWVELAGHDYVMDLIADLELPSDFPKQKSYFIISSDDPARVRANASLLVHKHVHLQIYEESLFTLKILIQL